MIKNNPLVEKYGADCRWVNHKEKVPYYSKNRKASTVEPITWKVHEQAEIDLDNGSNGFRGIGIVLHDSKLLCIDIDHVLEASEVYHPQEEKILKLLKEANTFTEISQSGTGLHLFFELSFPFTPLVNKKAPFEIYTKGRYIATTGNSYDKEPRDVRLVSTEKELLEILCVIGYPWNKETYYKQDETGPSKIENFSDEEVLKRMFSSKKGVALEGLYNGDTSKYDGDDSSADLAFCSHLAFWTSKNKEQIERIWLTSPLGSREKTRDRKDYRNRTIAIAISECNSTHISTDNIHEEEVGKSSQADLLLKMILGRKDVQLFKDERDASFISLMINGHRETWKCNSSTIKELMSYEFHKQKGKTLSSDVIKNVVSVLEGRARFGEDRKKLGNRVAFTDNTLWYDLTNKMWQAVKITDQGWLVTDEPPVIFKRYSHHYPQVVPEQNGNTKAIFNYVNIVNEEHKLLLLVYIIACFIPDFPHPALIISGSQGSAKSTLSKLLRKIIDPSLLEVVTLPKDQKELIQKLDHHYFTFFDNVSYISEETSDTFCKAITGSGFSKRVLYTDDDDIIYNFMRCIGINGISDVATRSDLLERSLPVELNRIDESRRKQESDLYKSFEKDLPSILGGIFDVLVKALRIYPTVHLDKLPRMADFTVWGCAIAEALGYTQREFVDAYTSNIKDQTKIALNDNPVAIAVILFMKDKDEWRGTATDLLTKLNNEDIFSERYGSGFPRGANSLTRKLNELRVNLRTIGIIYESKNSGDIRTITLKKVEKLLADDTDGVF